MMNIDEYEFKRVVKKYKDFVVGIKVRMSKSVVILNDVEFLKVVKRIKNEFNLFMMVYFGSFFLMIEDIFDYMEKGDILIYIYNGKLNGIFRGNEVKKEIIEVRERGIIFDVGYGIESFSMDIVMKFKDVGIFLDIISIDIYIKNRINGLVYNLFIIMEKFIYMGYLFEDIIDKVIKNVVDVISLKNKGLIKEGYDVDLIIFDVVNEEKEF